MRPLIRVEDFRRCVSREGFLKRRDAEVGFHRVRQTPRQNLSRRPIHDGDKVKEAPPHRDVGDIGAPDLVGPPDGQMPQQIRVDLVSWMRRAGFWRLIDRGEANLAHQSADSFAAGPPAEAAQMSHHLARAVKRAVEKCLVDEPHENEVLLALAGRLPIERRPRD